MAEEGCCVHLALQAPPVAIGDSALQVTVHERLEDIESRLEEEKPDLVAKKRFPWCLSDASSSSCDAEIQLRKGLIHCLVWCAKGVGWEARDETQRMPSLQGIIEIIAALPASSGSPRMAVVCLQYGAQEAARQLYAAGVPTVVWLSVDMLSDKCAAVFCGVVVPAVQLLDDGD
jgi:hypothetical protein